MNKRIRSMCYWVAGGAAAMVVAQNGGNLRPTVGDFRQDIQRGFGRGIHLAGVLVDENGTPLDDVNIGVTRREGRIREEYVVNRQFNLPYTNDLCVYVSFYKEGYYSEGKNGGYIVDEEVPVGPDGRRRIQQTNMVVVLRSIGGPVIKGAMAGEGLEFSVQGRDTGAVISGKSLRDFDKVFFEDVFTNALPTNAIILKPELTPDGFIATTNWFDPVNEVIQVRAINPGIEMTGMSNGFVRYTPQNYWPNYPGGVWREMRDCPENGYTNRLVVEAHETDVYAFFRLGGYYGKCRFGIRNVWTDDRTKLEVGIDGGIQPDGSRNVRTRNNW